MQNLNVAVIGGTGKSGKYLINLLLKHNIPIKALVRDPGKLQVVSPLMEVITGDVRSITDVRKLASNCQAVISTLGLGIPPSETSIFSQSTSNVLRVMREYDIKRYILTTGLNVDARGDKKETQSQMATEWMRKHYPETTTDKQKEYELLCESDAHWTLVRLPLIELTDLTFGISLSLVDCPGDRISASDLARFLIGQLHDKTYIRRSPFAANDRATPEASVPSKIKNRQSGIWNQKHAQHPT